MSHFGIATQRSGFVAALVATAALLWVACLAAAAGPPQLGESWASDVLASTAKLHGSINPNGLVTTYRFEYLTEAAYEANLAAGKDAFSGALRAPKIDGSAGAGTRIDSYMIRWQGFSS